MKNRSGFTLLEMMIVITIIGVLSALLTQAMPFMKEKARDKRRIHELANLQRQIELFRNETGAYPLNMTPFTFVTNDAFAATYGPSTISSEYVTGMVPNYFNELPVDPLPGNSSISGCEALGWKRNIAYFSNGEHYKLIYHCASETDLYGPDIFQDPARPDWAWAISDDMTYTTSLGW